MHRFITSCPAQVVLRGRGGPVVCFSEMPSDTGPLCFRATLDPFTWEDGVFRPQHSVPQSSLQLCMSQVSNSRGLGIKDRLARPRHRGGSAVRLAPGEGGLQGLGKSWGPGGTGQRRRGLCSYFSTGHRGPMLLCTAVSGLCWAGGGSVPPHTCSHTYTPDLDRRAPWTLQMPYNRTCASRRVGGLTSGLSNHLISRWVNQGLERRERMTYGEVEKMGYEAGQKGVLLHLCQPAWMA